MAPHTRYFLTYIGAVIVVGGVYYVTLYADVDPQLVLLVIVCGSLFLIYNLFYLTAQMAAEIAGVSYPPEKVEENQSQQ